MNFKQVRSALSRSPDKTRAGTVIDIGKALLILGHKKLQNGDLIAEKCGEGSFQFIKETQERAERFGERLKLSEKQYLWLFDIYEKVTR